MDDLFELDLRFSAAAALAAMIGFSAPANAAGPIRPFQFGLWSGGVFTNDQTGI
jgi:hypothetical protein